MKYDDAKQNCLDKFGSSTTGQLFEPRSLAINQEVHTEALKFSAFANDDDIWLGITDKKDGKYRYESDGVEVSMVQEPNGMWEDGQPNDHRYKK